ncbi:G-protein coupled receptor Mth2 isoform X9 [Dendroctonus ponderosae]|uniref:G-protein coupled receptor Mth2 isoform X9 n=1 Tax=Dendroctonus ponderosae TaxID=77166 RepID=UPI0020350326|nr:G-protein coupled receptor Mth2 isoform X9 [Dendroctonus ponderosae]
MRTWRQEKMAVFGQTVATLWLVFAETVFALNADDVCREDTICLQKCCKFNMAFVNATCTNITSDEYEWMADLLTVSHLPEENTSIVPIGPFVCPKGSDPAMHDKSEIEFFSDKIHLISAAQDVAYNHSCFENVWMGNRYGVHVLACTRSQSGLPRQINMVGMIISMPFLLITFLVYALLPDRNLHQRALMFYVLSLLIAYILLVTINLAPNIPTWFWCKFLGYSTLFFFMVSFFWMNVICFDIWYTFSGGRGFMGSKRTSERRRLIFYSLYANGVPLLIVAWTYGMQISLPNECEHNPGIGVAKCFLATGWASLWYFYLEAGIVVIANITFFILTALRIRKVKQETSMLKHNDSKRHTYEKDKQKFNLYVKLLFAMGVNWSMEVISWLVNWNTKSEYQYIWYATDFFNAVYGVFIFFIFVFKKKIWTLLQRRYYNFIGRPHLAHTVTSSNTRSSHYSSTNYSTADTGLSERATAVNGRQPAEEMALRRVT